MLRILILLLCMRTANISAVSAFIQTYGYAYWLHAAILFHRSLWLRSSQYYFRFNLRQPAYKRTGTSRTRATIMAKVAKNWYAHSVAHSQRNLGRTYHHYQNRSGSNNFGAVCCVTTASEKLPFRIKVAWSYMWSRSIAKRIDGIESASHSSKVYRTSCAEADGCTRRIPMTATSGESIGHATATCI